MSRIFGTHGPEKHRTPILNQGDADEKRETIRQYFHDTFSLDEQLYDTLASEKAFYLRPEPLRHPLIFYLGHTAAFYVNKLIVAKITNRRINPRFESMFAIGVDEMSWDDLNAAHYDWPTLDEVKAYRDTVRGVVDEAIRAMPLKMPINWDNPFWVILMGIEHERIHLETSSVIIRRLPIEMVRPLPLWSRLPRDGQGAAERAGAGGRRACRAGQVQGPPALRMGQRIRPPGRRRVGLRGQPLPGFQSGVPRLRRRAGLRTRGILDARGLEMGRLQQGPAPSVLDRCAWRLPISHHGRDHRHAVGLAGRGELPRGQGVLQLAGAKTGKPLRLPTEAEWHRLRDLHEIPDQPYWQQAPGERQSGTLGLVLPGESLLVRGVFRHRWQCLAVDGDADHGF